MAFSPLAVANHILDLADGDTTAVSPMKLIKLVYISHGWHLAITETEPLINETVEAWQYGPVVPSLYQQFKRFGNQPIDERAVAWRKRIKGVGRPSIHFFEPRLQGGQPDELETAQGVTAAVWGAYGESSAIRLSNLTHRPGTPWHEIWGQTGGKIIRGLDIPNDLIAKHYRSLASKEA